MKYGKLINGKVEYAPNKVVFNNHEIYQPSVNVLLALGYKPVIDERPYTATTEYAVAVGWDESEFSVTRVWETRPVEVTINDYDAAMEEHLRKAREERGYTTREPDVYINSMNNRWRQDAQDWISFRDTIMGIGLDVMNEYKRTGVVPCTLEAFKAGLPKIQWTEE